jgi:hypothetical protein
MIAFVLLVPRALPIDSWKLESLRIIHRGLKRYCRHVTKRLSDSPLSDIVRECSRTEKMSSTSLYLPVLPVGGTRTNRTRSLEPLCVFVWSNTYRRVV